MWRPEATWDIILRKSLHHSLNLPIRLDWLAREAQASFCLHLPGVTTRPHILSWILGINLRSSCLRDKHLINWCGFLVPSPWGIFNGFETKCGITCCVMNTWQIQLCCLIGFVLIPQHFTYEPRPHCGVLGHIVITQPVEAQLPIWANMDIKEYRKGLHYCMSKV